MRASKFMGNDAFHLHGRADNIAPDSEGASDATAGVRLGGWGPGPGGDGRTEGRKGGAGAFRPSVFPSFRRVSGTSPLARNLLPPPPARARGAQDPQGGLPHRPARGRLTPFYRL